jgi:hypothetical protein
MTKVWTSLLRLQNVVNRPAKGRLLAPGIAAAAIAAAALAVSGCGGGNSAGASDGSGEAQAEGPIVGVLIDQTCDATQAMRGWSREAVDTAVEVAARGGGTFLGEAVTTAEYQDAATDILKAFSSDKKSSSAKERDLQRQFEEFRQSTELKSFTTPKQGNCGSDLIAAVTAVSMGIADEPKATERSRDVIFVTNGIVIDDERGWNFVRDDMTPQYADRVIAAMEEEGTFPDLSGTAVSFVGLGDRQPPLTARKKADIQAFWAKLADTAGASTVADLGNVSQLRIQGQN